MGISETLINIWEKKTLKFLEGEPKCSQCGKEFNHFSRTMICRKCQTKTTPEQSRKYRQKHKKKSQAYQKKYRELHKDQINQRARIRYKEK